MLPTQAPKGSKSSLYPVLEKDPLKPPKPKPVLSPDDSVFIEFLSEEPLPYQPRPSAPAPGPARLGNEEPEGPDSTVPTLDGGSVRPSDSPFAGRLQGRRELAPLEETSRAFPLSQMGGPVNQFNTSLFLPLIYII